MDELTMSYLLTRWDTSSLRQIVIGGAAAPRALIEAYEKRHGLGAPPRSPPRPASARRTPRGARPQLRENPPFVGGRL